MSALVLAPATTLIAGLLLTMWLASCRANPVRQRLDRALTVGSGSAGEVGASFRVRVLAPLFAPAGRFALSATPQQSRSRLQELLEQAGRPISLSAFVSLRTALLLGLPGLYAGLLVLAHRPLSVLSFAMLVMLPLAGSMVPKRWLVRRAAARRQAIERALPDALDLIVVSMEAGLALDGAISKLVEKSKGPLRDELARMLQEIRLGKPRRAAMRELGQRTGVKDLAGVMNAIVQADQMGVSMGNVMRTQASEARLRRRQRASEMAHQAAVKMLFPLVLFILPSVVIVTVGPAALQIYHQMAKGFVV